MTADQATITMAPCPKCGSEWFGGTIDCVTRREQVICNHCRHTGPIAGSTWDAIVAWNRQAKKKENHDRS